MPVNRNLNQRARQALYSMKRDYGARIDIYKVNSSSADAKTGVRTIDKTVYPVKRAIALPERVDVAVQKSISLISSNKEFVSGAGGSYESGKRVFIVDRRDVPNLPDLSQDDWIVYNNRKFQIATVQWFEVDSGWVISTQELVGETPEQIFLGKTDSLLVFQSVASAVVE